MTERLLQAANKMVLCFPEDIEPSANTAAFNIPGYVVRELRDAVKEAENDSDPV